MSNSPKTVNKQPSFFRSLVVVMWSFFGVRKGSEFQKDIQNVNIIHLIGIGIGACILFVIGLMLIVRWVVTQ